MPDEETVVVEPQPVTVYCRHCGQPTERDSGDDSDWICSSCERYQDSMVCPTCHQVTRISGMAAEYIPKPHAPVKPKKEGESE